MSIERNLWGFDGEISFICDECGEEIHTEESAFDSALKHMKSYGWRCEKVDGEWKHYCGCDRDDDLEADFGHVNGD